MEMLSPPRSFAGRFGQLAADQHAALLQQQLHPRAADIVQLVGEKEIQTLSIGLFWNTELAQTGSSSTMGGAMGDLRGLRAMQPQKATREHHRGGDQLRDRDKTRKPWSRRRHARRRAGSWRGRQKEPGAEDFSITMRTMQEP